MAKKSKNHNEFFLSFFDNGDGYAEKEINGWWLIKHWDGNTQKYRADLYPLESYRAFKRNGQLFTEQKQQEGFLGQISKEL